MQPASELNPNAPEQFGPYELYERLGTGGMATVYRAKKRGAGGLRAHGRAQAHAVAPRRGPVVRRVVHSRGARSRRCSRTRTSRRSTTSGGSTARTTSRWSWSRARTCASAALCEPRERGDPVAGRARDLAELCDALEYAHGFVDEQRRAARHRPSRHVAVEPDHRADRSRQGHRLRHREGERASACTPRAGMAKGKLGYMAPEVALGMTVGPPADVFALGVVAWELITAQPLFTSRIGLRDDAAVARRSDHRRRRSSIRTAPQSSMRWCCAPPSAITSAGCRSASAFRRTLDQIAARTASRCRRMRSLSGSVTSRRRGRPGNAHPA